MEGGEGGAATEGRAAETESRGGVVGATEAERAPAETATEVEGGMAAV